MPSYLLITKDKFRSDIALQIAEGKAILDQYNKTQEPSEGFRKLYRAYEQWDSYNQSWLEHIFSGERNSYEVGYENAATWNTERMNAARQMAPDSLNFKFRFFESYITPKIEFLEDLQAKSVLLPVRLPLPDNQSQNFAGNEQGLPTPTMIPAPLHQPAAMAAPNISIAKIFISHSSKDAEIVGEVIDLVETMGVRQEQIFCSSFPGYGVALGEDFLQRIKNELNNNTLVLFILTPNFYASRVCLCEMGATWVKTTSHIPILIPPIDYKDVSEVIPLTQGFKIDEPLKWNEFKEQIEKWFAISSMLNSSAWERKRDKAIRVINAKIDEDHPKVATQKPAKSDGRGGWLPAE